MNCDKVKYSSEKYAQLDIQRIRRVSVRDKKPMRAYLCNCGSWHLTSRTDFKEDIISELKQQIESLKLENINLKKLSSSEKAKIKKDEKVSHLSAKIAKQNILIKKMRNEISRLIIKNIQT